MSAFHQGLKKPVSKDNWYKDSQRREMAPDSPALLSYHTQAAPKYHWQGAFEVMCLRWPAARGLKARSEYYEATMNGTPKTPLLNSLQSGSVPIRNNLTIYRDGKHVEQT